MSSKSKPAKSTTPAPKVDAPVYTMAWQTLRAADGPDLRVLPIDGVGCLVLRDDPSGSLLFLNNVVFQDGKLASRKGEASGVDVEEEKRRIEEELAAIQDRVKQSRNKGAAVAFADPKDPGEVKDDLNRREEEHFVANQQAYEHKNDDADPANGPAPQTLPNANPAPRDEEKPGHVPDSLRSQLAPRLPDLPTAPDPAAPKDPRVFGAGNMRIG